MEIEPLKLCLELSWISIVKHEQNPQLNMWILKNIPISSSHVTLNAYINVYSTIIQFFIFHIHASSFTMYCKSTNFGGYKFGVSQNKVIYVNLAAIKFGVSPRPVYAVYDRRICWRRQILAKRRNSPNSPNIIARQNLLIYSIDKSQMQ